MKDIGIRISYNIKKIMKQKNIKQFELAEKLGRTKSATNTIFYRLEKNNSTNLKTLIDIAKVLDVDVSFFFANHYK